MWTCNRQDNAELCWPSLSKYHGWIETKETAQKGRVTPTRSEPLLCPCWTGPGTGAPQRCVVQSRFGPACLRPGCAGERPQAGGQRTLGSFQTRSGPWPRHASAAGPSPLSPPLCPSRRCCWPSLRPLQRGDLSPGWREFRNPNTEEQLNVGSS